MKNEEEIKDINFQIKHVLAMINSNLVMKPWSAELDFFMNLKQELTDKLEELAKE